MEGFTTCLSEDKVTRLFSSEKHVPQPSEVNDPPNFIRLSVSVRVSVCMVVCSALLAYISIPMDQILMKINCSKCWNRRSID